MNKDLKISELPISTSLDGNELIPIVQNNSNKTINITKLIQKTYETVYKKEEIDKNILNLKTESDNLYQKKGNYATKQEVTEATKDILTKNEASNTYQPKGDYATKAELNAKLNTSVYNSEKANFATKTEIGNINTILDKINGEVI